MMYNCIKQFLKILLILMLVVNINQIPYNAYADEPEINDENEEEVDDDIKETLSYADEAEPGDFSALNDKQKKGIKAHLADEHLFFKKQGIFQTELIHTKHYRFGDLITMIYNYKDCLLYTSPSPRDA